MSQTQRTPVVPLEAGIGPENPPCPACGEPLFGWIDSTPGLSGPAMRCESCGLGVVDGPGDDAAALRALDQLAGREKGPHDPKGAPTVTIVNRDGFAAWIGGIGWAGLEADARYLFTPEAVRRLVAGRDQVVRRARWAPAAGIAATWQTFLNGFTFGRNIALGALGKARPVPAGKPWQRRLDGLVSVLVAIPALVFAAPIELLAAALRRGGAVALDIEAL